MSQHDEMPISTAITPSQPEPRDAAGSFDVLTVESINARRQQVRQQQTQLAQRRLQLQQEVDKITQNLFALDGAQQVTYLLLQDAGLSAEQIQQFDQQ